MGSSLSSSPWAEIRASMIALSDPRAYGGVVPNVEVLSELSSTNPLASITYAYYALHRELSRNAVSSSARGLTTTIRLGGELGAAPLLLLECELFLAEEQDWARIDTRLLNISLEHEPEWSRNWLFLGWHQSAKRDWQGAAGSFRKALDNMCVEPATDDPVQIAYEEMFTGRIGDRNAISWQMNEAIRKSG